LPLAPQLFELGAKALDLLFHFGLAALGLLDLALALPILFLRLLGTSPFQSGASLLALGPVLLPLSAALLPLQLRAQVIDLFPQ
jgi:hypothetical protein